MVWAGDEVKAKPRKRNCPKCNSIHIVPIVYGYPDSNLKEKFKQGKAVSGGCEIWGGEPNWHCKDCEEEFNDGDDPYGL